MTAYFDFYGTLVERKKKWLRSNMAYGHNKTYSYSYDTVSNMWRGGCSSKRVTGVFIYDDEKAKEFYEKWQKRHRYRVEFDRAFVSASKYYLGDMIDWCEENAKGKWSIVPIFGQSEKEPPFSKWIFSSSNEKDLLGFKLRWL